MAGEKLYDGEMRATNGHSGGAASDGMYVSKKDKRRLNISTKLERMSEVFEQERDQHYRLMLHNLQKTLATMHSGTNKVFIEHLTDLEEIRDYELIRLRLWEKYQLEMNEKIFNEELDAANEEHENSVKLMKEKLYERIEKQMKRLKEDKALLDVANDHSYFLSSSYNLRSPSSPGSSYERRSLRRRNEYLDDSTGLSADSSVKKRRGNGNGNRNGNGNGYRSGSRYGSGGGSTAASGDDQKVSDSDSLQGILAKRRNEQRTHSVNPHGHRSGKAYNGVSALKPEEVNDDLVILRQAIIDATGKKAEGS